MFTHEVIIPVVIIYAYEVITVTSALNFMVLRAKNSPPSFFTMFPLGASYLCVSAKILLYFQIVNVILHIADSDLWFTFITYAIKLS